MNKELWNIWEAEYNLEDGGVERIEISNFTNYKMVNKKPIWDQIHALKELLKSVK